MANVKEEYVFGWSDPRTWSYEELLYYWYCGVLPKKDNK